MSYLTDKQIQSLTTAELAENLRILRNKKLEPLSRDQPLPYCFDLFHDIKEWYEIDNILKGEPHCSGLGSYELREFAQEHGYVIDKPVDSLGPESWESVSQYLELLYARHQMSLRSSSAGGTVHASCIDSQGYYHFFNDMNPTDSVMRCALAVLQVKPSAK